MSGLLKRFRKADEIAPSPQGSVSGSAEHSDNLEKNEQTLSARDISEAEANRKLAIFERTHKWDPNLDNDQLLEIDAAVHTRDPNAEVRIYDEVFENSPYPEVGLVFRYMLSAHHLTLRIGSGCSEKL
jgi:hypothetical protein